MPQSITTHHYARRLQRLLTLINEIKTTPHQTPEALYTGLGISRAMFYKDCQVLQALGLAFHYDRQQRRYIITQDRYLPVLDLSTSEMLAPSSWPCARWPQPATTPSPMRPLRPCTKSSATPPPRSAPSCKPRSTMRCCKTALAATPRSCMTSGRPARST